MKAIEGTAYSKRKVNGFLKEINEENFYFRRAAVVNVLAEFPAVPSGVEKIRE